MTPFNIMGIDPGSRNVGVCVYTILPVKTNNPKAEIDFEIQSISTHNLCLDTAESENGIHENILDRTNKLRFIMSSLYTIYKPAIVSIESCFINLRRPGAVIPLARSIHAIESAILDMDINAKITSITPGAIKKTFKAKQIGKDAVLTALQNNKEVMNRLSNKDITEHEIDAIAIAYTLLQLIKESGGMICIQHLQVS